MLAHLIWNPKRTLFVLPYVNHPVVWYGVLFAFGFFVAYLFIRKIFSAHLLPEINSQPEAKLAGIVLADRLIVLVVIGTIIGARVGHVLFYGWNYYSAHPEDIFKVWEGGLASHGGAIGIFIALALFYVWNRKCYPSLTFLAVLDAVVLTAPFVGGCIRVGNFINQEILGIPTSLPWGIIFVRPLDGMAGVPVHPVQLYEAIWYFLVFTFLIFVWRREKKHLGRGFLSGWFFLLVFGFRFLIEFLKVPQTELLTHTGLLMGQWLSLPFIVLGVILLVFAWRRASV